MTFDSIATGSRIKAVREDHGITAVKASSELNISLGTYRKIESGERGLSVDVLLLISEYFGVSTDYILKGYVVDKPSSDEIAYIIARLKSLQQKL